MPLIVPLALRRTAIGTLALGGPGARVSPDLTLRLAEEFAARASVALDNAGLLATAVRARADAEAAQGVAERANRAKTDFLTAMSHELRTPLNAILGYVQLMDMEIRGPLTDAQRADLHRIARVEQHLSHVIGQLLGFAKIDSGHLTYDLTDVPLDDVLRHVDELILPAMEGKRLTFEPERCDPALTAWADRDKLEQILLNLLSNAVKFTDAGGRITIWCEGTDQTATISVRDTGRGIPADRTGVIFEPFVQLDHGLTRGKEGTGLGLTISRDLARGMGGDLEVMTSLGSGSTFTVSVPQAASTSAHGAAPTGLRSESSSPPDDERPVA
ncbi:MAG: sensor histidine kinase [Gemmatimonadaceae bacterium]